MDGTTRSVRILGLTGVPGALAPGAFGDRPVGPSSPAALRGQGAAVEINAAEGGGRARFAWLLSAALFFSIFQFYVLPVGDFFVSLGLMSGYSLILLVSPSRIFAHPLAKLFTALLAVDVASLTWSPEPFQGFRDIVFITPFLITFLAARSIAERDERAVVACIKVFCLAACLHSALIIVMAVSPAVKTLVFSSPAGHLFINPNSVNALLSGNASSNVSDPAKAGGFVGNGNVAGAWAATALFGCVAITAKSRGMLASVFWSFVALIHAAAIVACGSKAGLSLLLMTPVVILLSFMVLPPPGRRPNIVLILGVIVVAMGVVAAGADAFVQSHYYKATAFTLASRIAIWSHAWDEFQRTPLLGLGYGGWTESFSKVGYAYAYLGIDGTFPPHNALIILWAQSGLLALLLGIGIIVTLVRAAAAPRTFPGGSRLAVGALGAYLFVTAQSMGENFGLFGDPHIQIPLAALLGWASVYQTRYRPKRR